MRLRCPCIRCRNVINFEVPEEQWALYISPNRPLIQECFPDLSPAERELLISGYCDTCFKQITGEVES